MQITATELKSNLYSKQSDRIFLRLEEINNKWVLRQKCFFPTQSINEIGGSLVAKNATSRSKKTESNSRKWSLTRHWFEATDNFVHCAKMNLQTKTKSVRKMHAPYFSLWRCLELALQDCSLQWLLCHTLIIRQKCLTHFYLLKFTSCYQSIN